MCDFFMSVISSHGKYKETQWSPLNVRYTKNTKRKQSGSEKERI